MERLAVIAMFGALVSLACGGSLQGSDDTSVDAGEGGGASAHGGETGSRAIEAPESGPPSPSGPPSDERDPDWVDSITPPVCSPGKAAADIAVSSQAEAVDLAGGADQTFVASTTGTLTRIDVALRRCQATPGDRIMIVVREDADPPNLVAETSVAFVPIDCGSASDLDAAVVFDLHKDCGHVIAGKRYRFTLFAPIGVNATAAPRFVIARSVTDAYAQGEMGLRSESGSLEKRGDAVFRAYVAP